MVSDELLIFRLPPLSLFLYAGMFPIQLGGVVRCMVRSSREGHKILYIT